MNKDLFSIDAYYGYVTCLYFRARSVYERAIDVDHRCIPIWLKYAEMEMKYGILTLY